LPAVGSSGRSARAGLHGPCHQIPPRMPPAGRRALGTMAFECRWDPVPGFHLPLDRHIPKSPPDPTRTGSGLRVPVPTATEKRHAATTAPFQANHVPSTTSFARGAARAPRLERGQSHCFSDRGQSGKPGGVPRDGMFSSMIARPVPASRVGLFASRDIGFPVRKFSCTGELIAGHLHIRIGTAEPYG
jgi:hypothetical protein